MLDASTITGIIFVVYARARMLFTTTELIYAKTFMWYYSLSKREPLTNTGPPWGFSISTWNILGSFFRRISQQLICHNFLLYFFANIFFLKHWVLKQTRTPNDGHNYSKNISKQNITLLKLKRADYMCKPNMLKRENFMKI